MKTPLLSLPASRRWRQLGLLTGAVVGLALAAGPAAAQRINGSVYQNGTAAPTANGNEPGAPANNNAGRSYGPVNFLYRLGPAAPNPPAAWRERILTADGSINWTEYQNVAANADQPWALDERFGPKWSYFHPNDAGSAPTVWGRTGELPPGTILCCGDNPQEQRQQYQYQDGWLTFFKDRPVVGYQEGNGLWFAYSGQLLYAPNAASDAGLARARSYADYHAGHSGSSTSTYDLKVSWTRDAANFFNQNPDPAVTQPGWVAAAGGTTPRTPVAVDRGRFMHSSIMAVVAYKNGLIGATSTGNAVDRYPYLQLPAGKTPTAVAVTQNNELILVTVWDAANRKGQLAVIVPQGELGSGVVSGEPDYWGLWYWPETKGLKLLGFVDLPVAAPSGVSATVNVSHERMGRDYPRDETLRDQDTRDKFAASVDARHTLPSAGWAVVSSRAENKVVFVDLKPLIQYYRQMYFGSAANYNATQQTGPAANQWPHTFAHAPQQTPTVAQTLTVPQPTAVAAGYDGGIEGYATGWDVASVPVNSFQGKAWVTTLGGELRIYDVGGLQAGTGANVTLQQTVTVGKNPTHLDYGRGADYTNVFITCRGDRAVYKVDLTGRVLSVLRDSRLQDPVSSHASVGIGPHVLSVLDFDGQAAHNYLHRPLDPFGTIEGGGLGPDGKAPFEWTYSTPVPALPVHHGGSHLMRGALQS